MKNKLILLLSLVISFSIQGQTAEESYNIYILHSYHPEFFWTEKVAEGIQEGLIHSSLNLNIYTEYMDYKHFPDFPRESLIETLKWKMKRAPPSVIIVSDNGALDFAMDLRSELFPEIPVVFCGINGIVEEIIKGEKNITGIAERWDPKNTLKLIHQLQPEVTNLLVLQDFTESGLGTLVDFQKISSSYDTVFTYEILPHEPIDRIVNYLNSFGSNSAILLLGYNRDSQGRVFDSNEIAQVLVEKTEIPLYTMDETRAVEGSVGGSLLSGFGQGNAAAEMALQILKGTPPSKIPVILNPQPNLVVNYPALQHFRISENRIPEDAEIRNRPVSFYKRNKLLIWIALFVILIFFFMIYKLILNILKIRRIEMDRLQLVEILEITPDIVSFSTMDKTIKYINEAGKELIGYNPEGNKIPTIHPPGFEEFLTKEALPELEKNGTWSGETRLLTHKGEISVSQVILLHRNKDGSPSYLSTIMRDISSQKEDEKKIRQSEENLRITVDSLKDAVFSTDAQGSILQINPAAESLCGGEEIKGRPIDEVILLQTETSDIPLENPVMDVLKNGQSVNQLNNRKTYFIDKEGKRRNVTYNAAPIYNSDKEIQRVVLVIRDISEEIQLQEQLSQSRKMKVIGQLAGGVAHDFNNLLTVILGTAELLNQVLGNDEEKKQFAEDIISASLKASELTSHLLTFSRKAQFYTRPFHLHDIINEVIRLLSRSIDKQIQIQEKLEAREDVIMGDPVALQTALLNLAVNSRDAIHKRGTISFSSENIIISIETTEIKELLPGEYLRISVEDDGAGIPSNIQPRIFEPYFTTKPIDKGTGLGLAAVYGCIKSHNGYIQVYSEEGKGSSFHIYLPLAKKDGETLSLNHGKALQKGTGSIILIDDEEELRKIAGQMLMNLGYQVNSFSNGRDGIDYYREQNDAVDLVILDLIMPGLTGTETFHQLKEINPDVKVLLSSGFVHHQNIGELMKEGARGFINKPYQLNDLSHIVWKCLSGEIIAPSDS